MAEPFLNIYQYHQFLQVHLSVLPGHLMITLLEVLNQTLAILLNINLTGVMEIVPIGHLRPIESPGRLSASTKLEPVRGVPSIIQLCQVGPRNYR